MSITNGFDLLQKISGKTKWNQVNNNNPLDYTGVD